jgi:molecular chaperone GrpE
LTNLFIRNVTNENNVDIQDNETEASDASTASATEDASAPEDANGASAGDAADTADADDPEARVESLEEELDELNDRLLRQAAEFQNFRRRMKRENERRFTSGKKEVVLPMLDVLDDFERSIEAAEELEDAKDKEAAYEQLKSGVEMIFSKFVDELNTLGVEPIDAKGEPFNENEHEAMMQQPAPDDVEEGTVLEEIRKGYRMDDQVLRHSRVIVAS